MHDPSRTEPVVRVRLLTRGAGELSWRDRGAAFVPARATTAPAQTVRFDAATYLVEDVFDDGAVTTVWARLTRGPRRRR